MIGYLVLFGLIFFIDMAKVPLGKKYLLSFWVLSVFSGIRYGIGYDYFSYYELMLNPENERELISNMFLFIGREIHYSLFFILTSFFINFFFIRGMYIRNCPFETIYFYIGWPLLYVSSFSTVRQFMAISIIFYLMCLKKDKILIKLLFILLAFSCHRSSLIAVILLFPIEKYLNRNILWILFVSSLFLGEFFVEFLLSMSFDSSFLNNFLSFLGEEAETGRFKKMLSYFIVVLILTNYRKLTDCGVPSKYLVYSVVGGCFFALFSIQPHIAMRFCIFFQVSFMLFVIKTCRLRRFPLFAYKAICVTLFALSIYVGHKTSLEFNNWDKYKASSYYPYETIFENSPTK